MVQKSSREQGTKATQKKMNSEDLFRVAEMEGVCMSFLWKFSSLGHKLFLLWPGRSKSPIGTLKDIMLLNAMAAIERPSCARCSAPSELGLTTVWCGCCDAPGKCHYQLGGLHFYFLEVLPVKASSCFQWYWQPPLRCNLSSLLRRAKTGRKLAFWPAGRLGG